MASQLPLFPHLTATYPSTRYQGSKAKLVDWIWAQLSDLPFSNCLDAFGGTGIIAYRMKQEGKQVTYNDLLRFNALFGKALIENADVRVSQQVIDELFREHDGINYPTFIHDTFQDVYFTDGENYWLDVVITNIRALSNEYERALAFFALAQSCIIKRPYNLFHRKNLYLRFADVERSFGNKTTWDKPFEAWFRQFMDEANEAVFDNGEQNVALNKDVFELDAAYDLVYIDPPYISSKGVATDYRDFYHFLEGMTIYGQWAAHVDYASKHRRLKKQPNVWSDKHQIMDAFDRVFKQFADSIIVVSYRSDGIPSIEQIEAHLKRYKSDVRVEYYGQYQYVLSKNLRSQEVLMIA